MKNEEEEIDDYDKSAIFNGVFIICVLTLLSLVSFFKAFKLW